MNPKLEFTPTRSHGLNQLNSFLNQIPYYSSKRNFVTPSLKEVSTLSPYIRLRLISEEEVISTVLEKYSLQIAEKFIQEVCWRSYWKNWLELHPHIWSQYSHFLSVSLSPSILKEITLSENAQTEIPTFNEWVIQLKETGYLHNHIRMYFASIWIHTLQLPWQYGAQLFMKHLYDADPASNTLSWRWVAGLHTKGKSYLAKPENISLFTGSAFNSGHRTLASIPYTIEEQDVCEIKNPQPIKDFTFNDECYFILINEEELSLEFIIPESTLKKSIIIFIPTFYEEPQRSKVFREAALHDARMRMSIHAKEVFFCNSTIELEKILDTNVSNSIVAFMPFTGSCKDRFLAILSDCKFFQQIIFANRRWDTLSFFPKSSGFFTYWKFVREIVKS
jgi:deoxyribodipyrimidine photo-lyase